MFTNREIAIAIWLFVIFVLALSRQDFRKALLNFFIILFKPKILILLGCMALYTIVVVAGLYFSHFWNITLLKDTVFWFFFAAMLMLIQFTTSKNNEKVFSKIITDNIKVIIIIEFLINTYTFSLPVELLIVPFAALISMVDAFVQASKKHSVVAKITTKLQAFIGLFILFSAVFKAAINYETLQSLDTFKSLILPPMLSILFSPFIYLTVLYTNYELLFVYLDMGPDKDKALKQYAKLSFIKNCKLSLKRVRKFLKENGPSVPKIQSRVDVEGMIQVKFEKT